MDNKTFINGVFIREKQFDNGGSIIKIEIPNVSEFADQLIKHANSNGKVTLDLKERMNKADNGLTHYLQLNTFVPKEQTTQQTSQSTQGFSQSQSGDDGLPF